MRAASSSAVFVSAVLTLVVGSARAEDSTPTYVCPPEMALLSSAHPSCIDRWEASLVERRRDGSEVPFSPYRTPRGHDVRAVSLPDVVPQGHINMALAARACRAAKKRLCHPNEWIAACVGSSRTRYPYGDRRIPGVCIDSGRTAPLAKFYSGDEMYENRNMNDARLNQVDNTVEKTGVALQCVNELGVYDLVGNVNEWVDDQTMRGGFYLDDVELGEGCGYATKVHSAVYNDYSTGFRCCVDAHEETLTSLSPLVAIPIAEVAAWLSSIVTASSAGPGAI